MQDVDAVTEDPPAVEGLPPGCVLELSSSARLLGAGLLAHGGMAHAQFGGGMGGGGMGGMDF